MTKRIGIFVCLLVLAVTGLFAQEQDALKLYKAGQYSDAIAVCEKELKKNPGSINSYTVLIWSLLATKQYLQAEERALQARKKDAYDIFVIEALAEAEYFLGKNDEALKYFQNYVSNARDTEGDYALSYFYMGEIYVKQSKFRHADIAFTTAVKFKPQKANWWSRLGYAREMCKEYTSAIDAYDHALSLSPSLYDATTGKKRCQSHL